MSLQPYATAPKNSNKAKVFAGRVGMTDGVESDIVDTVEYLRYLASSDPRCEFDETTGILWFNTAGEDPSFEGVPLGKTPVVYALGNSYHIAALHQRLWEASLGTTQK